MEAIAPVKYEWGSFLGVGKGNVLAYPDEIPRCIYEGCSQIAIVARPAPFVYNREVAIMVKGLLEIRRAWYILHRPAPYVA